MESRINDRFPDLTSHYLPGPDTSTKFAAAESRDPRLRLMLEESMRVGWPAAFTDDLYLHDRQTLERHPAATMIWILRLHGTHLYPAQCDNSHAASYYRRVIDYWSGDHKLNSATHENERARYYLVTEAGLTEIGAKEAQENIRFMPRE